ncbi:Uncharacterised protein [Mycobacteroides abscessus subsp. abscessus]|nr:Uncharacterised protein [Mycobacteroides abscessus subsp. abscessus]
MSAPLRSWDWPQPESASVPAVATATANPATRAGIRHLRESQ